jgi:hypothetical protein
MVGVRAISSPGGLVSTASGHHHLVYEVGGQEALAAAPFCALGGQVGAASLGAGDT